MMKRQLIKMRTITGFMVLCLWGTPALANNIEVSNAAIVSKNGTEMYAMVQFDISWDNSWRVSTAPNNRDAAWVFVKYRTSGGEWKHAWLNHNGHAAPAGSAIDVGLLNPGSSFNATTNPGLGVFIYRSADGSGTFSLSDVELRWNYGNNGVTNDDVVDVLVYAVEMVYVPGGSFYVGSGGTESGSFTDGSWTSGNTLPFQINSENEIQIQQSAGNLWSTAYGTNQEGNLPAQFPKGYRSFYCMKYEITQQQYVDFLNSLSRSQQKDRFPSGYFTYSPYQFNDYQVGYYVTNPHDPSLNPPNIETTTPKCRNGIRFMADPGSPHPRVFGNDLNNNGIAGEVDDGQNIACNFLSWQDFAAILDWMGLRPMTELEYEKACRGQEAPAINGYAWGTDPAVQSNAIGGDIGGSTEVVRIPINANAVFGNHAGVQGPVRTGIFAKSSTGRSTAGASYYGIMEMSGNAREWIVNANLTWDGIWSSGRDYTGKHGDGELDSFGYPNVEGWPPNLHSIGLRGGDWANPSDFIRVSERVHASMPSSNQPTYGGRGVRTAP